MPKDAQENLTPPFTLLCVELHGLRHRLIDGLVEACNVFDGARVGCMRITPQAKDAGAQRAVLCHELFDGDAQLGPQQAMGLCRRVGAEAGCVADRLGDGLGPALFAAQIR